ncbi:putative bromodomain protein [Trichinella spiralis]|uniref:putative bromodomain protein n=1 Tax=Trichinella spiralis TaxID=6334 RepID=UPI0001EFC59F|nr:putative bromodomain protein [Trichinella spiralis]
MFDFNKILHRIFSWGWEAAGYGCNPFGPDPSSANFHDLPLYARIKIVYTLCELRLLKSDIESMFKDINSDCLRLLPLGEDRNGITYWYFYGTRLYGEYPDLTVKIRPEKSKKRGRPKSESVPEEVSDYEGSDHENTDEETSFGSTKRDRNSSETSQTEYYAIYIQEQKDFAKIWLYSFVKFCIFLYAFKMNGERKYLMMFMNGLSFRESAPVYPRVGAVLRTTASTSKDVDDEGETNSLNDMVHCTYNSDYDDSNVGMDDNEVEYGNVHNVSGAGSGESSVVVKEEPVDEQSLLKLENLQAVKNCWDPNNVVIKKETAEQEVKINLDDFHAQSTFSCNVDLPSEISRTTDTACERTENKNEATKDSCREETKTAVVNEEKNRPNVKETSCAVANNNNNNQAWNQPSLIPPTRTRWFVKCDTMQDWHDFVNTLAKSSYANERHLHSLLSENFLSEIESFFIQKNQPSQIEVQQSLLNVASHYETNPIIEEAYEPEEEVVYYFFDNWEAVEGDFFLFFKKKQISEVSRQLRPRVRTVRLDDGDGSAESGDEEGGVKNTSSMSREMRYKQREIEKEKGEKLRERAKEERARRLELRLKRQELLAEGRDLSEDVLGRAASSVNYAYTNELDIQMELEHMYGQLEKLIDSFKESPDAWPFLEPVTEDIAPGYFQKIKVFILFLNCNFVMEKWTIKCKENPMDLHTIEAKLYSREYRNKIEFIEDVNAMLINCLEFNGLKNGAFEFFLLFKKSSSVVIVVLDYTKMAQRLERTFIRLWKRYFPPSRSADYDDTYEDELTCVSMLGVLDRKIKDLVQPKSDTPCIEISNIICQQSSLPKQAIKVNSKLFIKFSLDRPNERILISSVGTPWMFHFIGIFDVEVSVAPVIQVSATHGVRSVGQKLILLQSNPLVIRDNAAVVNNNSNSSVNFTSEAASAITLRTG